MYFLKLSSETTTTSLPGLNGKLANAGHMILSLVPESPKDASRKSGVTGLYLSFSRPTMIRFFSSAKFYYVNIASHSMKHLATSSFCPRRLKSSRVYSFSFRIQLSTNQAFSCYHWTPLLPFAPRFSILSFKCNVEARNATISWRVYALERTVETSWVCFSPTKQWALPEMRGCNAKELFFLRLDT
jgi:hypothetical protein